MQRLLQRLAREGIAADDFLAPRRCLREPVPEIQLAASLLDRAVDAHLSGAAATAGALIQQADMPAIRAFTESLWGSATANPDQWRHIRLRPIDGAAPLLPRADRIQVRMPSRAEQRTIIEKYGYNCAFCGMPVIRREIRTAMAKAYPEALSWGGTNGSQHAAFQCMWLQFDHVLPHSRGGGNALDNVVVTCAPCNYGRLDNLLAEVGVLDPRTRPVQKTSWDGLERFLANPR